MDEQVENFSLKVHIGPLKIYRPTEQRLGIEAQRIGVLEKDYVLCKKTEWDCNYQNSCEIINDHLEDSFGVGYKETARPDVELKLK